MAPPPPRSLAPILTFSGMVFFLAGISTYPRISVHRSPDSTTLTYRHLSASKSNPPPSDPGFVISDPVRSAKDAHSEAQLRRYGLDMSKSWILDTGATSHVCCRAEMMHGLVGFEHSPMAKAVSHFGPNPISVKGIGDVSIDIIDDTASRSVVLVSQVLDRGGHGSTSPSGSKRGTGSRSVGERITIRNVSYIPEAGANLLSWSQLKRANGGRMTLREGKDGTLEVWYLEGRSEGRRVMNFVQRGGLYFLEQSSTGSSDGMSQDSGK